METGLPLLMRDGPVRLEFHPHLTSEQYAELLEIVKQLGTAAIIGDLIPSLSAAADRWGVSFDYRRVPRQ